MQVVQPPQKQQVGDLFDDLQRVGDAAGPEGIPDAVDLAPRYAAGVAHPSDLEARMAALEARFDDVAADAAAARHLAAARDRDLAGLPVKVDANRKAINALGVQTAARFDRLEEAMANGFIEMRGKFDATAAGQQQIVTLLTTLIGQQDEQ